MPDSAASNMNLFDNKLHDFKKVTLEYDVNTHFLFCNAHFLLRVTTATEKAAKGIEREHGS